MIKINLLPHNIFEARTIKRLIGLFAVIAILLIVGGVVYSSSMVIDLSASPIPIKIAGLQAQTAAMKMEADRVEDLTNQASSWKTQATSKRGSIKPITQKVEFIKAVAQHNSAYPDMYEELARFTYGKIVYGKLVLSGNTITLDAHAPNLSDAGRYIMNLYRATHLFTTVAMSQVPGYTSTPQGTIAGLPGSPGFAPPSVAPTGPASFTTSSFANYAGLAAVASGVTKTNAANPGFDFNVTLTLKNPPAMPVLGGGEAAAGLPGATNMPGAGAGSSMPGAGGPHTSMPGFGGAPVPGPSKSTSNDGMEGGMGRRMGGGEG